MSNLAPLVSKTKLPKFFGRLFVAFLLIAPAWGQDRPRAMADFDVRDMTHPPVANADQPRARTVVEQRRARLERAAGARVTPNRFGLPGSYLTEAQPRRAASAGTAEDTARNFLRSNRDLFLLTGAEIGSLRLASRDEGSGGSFLAFNQTLNGIDVFNGSVKFTLSPGGEVVYAGAADLVPELSISTTPRLSAREAVGRALEAAGIRAAPPAETASSGGKAEFRNPQGGRFSPITAELSIFPMTAVTARLAYRILLEAGAVSWYEILIDAEDGVLLYRQNLYSHAAQGRVYVRSPLDDTRELVTFPDGWLPAAGTVTTGNNVDAYLDTNGDDKPDNSNSAGLNGGRAFSAEQLFDFPFGDGLTAQNPRTFQAAAATNLFYLVNRAHDYFYGLGFNEAAGNFQTDNFGRGGQGNDAVVAEAQNSVAIDNAMFASTPDGTAPRMRLGIFRNGTSSQNDDLDSAFDGHVVVHEYTHGVSNRLVGGRTNLGCLRGVQSGAMGEGWSDYFASSYFDTPVAAAYVSRNLTRGLRRHSYEGYPYTFEDLGNVRYEVHDDGEIWAAALWELRQVLGQRVADQLVLNGLKSTSCNPTMVSARDAILAADQAGNAGANRARIWQVFARHGLGYSASGIDGRTYPGIYHNAAFDLPPDLQQRANPAITSRPPAALPRVGEQFLYTVTASNPNGGTLAYTLAQGPPGMTIDGAGVLRWTATFTQERVKIVVTDGGGGKVVHGFILTPETPLSGPLVIQGAQGSRGYAQFTVPRGVQVLQFTTRGATGDTDLTVLDPDGVSQSSARDGSNETLSFVNPKTGIWRVTVSGYRAYSEVTLAPAIVVPRQVAPNSRIDGVGGVLGSETFYRVSVPAGAESLTISTSGGSGDVDLYVRKDTPPVCQVSVAVSTPCTEDRSSAEDGNTESVAITTPAAGDWYFTLSGFREYSNLSLSVTLLPTGSGTTPAGALAAAPGWLSFEEVTAGGGAVSKAIAVSASSAGMGWTASASTAAGGNWLTVSPQSGAGSGTVQVSVNPSALAQGSYLGTVTVVAADAANSPLQIPVMITVTAPAPVALPTISTGGVVGGGGSVPAVSVLSPGGFASVFGSSFAPSGTARAVQAGDLVSGRLPTSLAGVCVEVEGKRGFVTFVSPGQINFQTPEVTPDSTMNVQVISNCGLANEARSAAAPARTAAASPELLYWVRNADGKNPVVAVDALSGAYVGPAGAIPGLTFNAAKPGDILTIFGISFGPTEPSFRPGEAPTVTARTVNPPSVRLGAIDLNPEDVLYAGVSPGIAGLYQLNIRIPLNAGDGDHAITLRLGAFTAASGGYVRVRASGN